MLVEYNRQGNQTRVKVVKNKLAPPFKEAEFDILYGEGISWCAELIDIRVDNGIIGKNGSWYPLSKNEFLSFTSVAEEVCHTRGLVRGIILDAIFFMLSIN